MRTPALFLCNVEAKNLKTFRELNMVVFCIVLWNQWYIYWLLLNHFVLYVMIIHTSEHRTTTQWYCFIVYRCVLLQRFLLLCVTRLTALEKITVLPYIDNLAGTKVFLQSAPRCFENYHCSFLDSFIVSLKLWGFFHAEISYLVEPLEIVF